MSRILNTRRELLLLLTLLLILLSSFLPARSRAQVQSCPGNILKNGDFTSFTIGSDTNFPPSTVANWVKSSGTPQIAPGQGCGNAGYIAMWGNKGVGESVSQTGLIIKKDHRYRLTACVKWPGAAPPSPQYVRVNVRASMGLPTSYTATSPSAPSIGIIGGPANTPPPGITSQSWTTVTLADWIAPADFDTITFNPENDFSANDSSAVSWVNLDNACLVEVFPPEIESLATACQNSLVHFATSAAGPWKWSFSESSTTSSQQTTDHPYLAAGVYSVTLCAGSATNCTTKSITIKAAPPTPVITGPTSSCGNQLATYSVPATSGATYLWTATNGTITGPANANTVNVNWSTAGTGVISVTVSNKEKCSSSAKLEVTSCDLHQGECCKEFLAKTDLEKLVDAGNGLYNLNLALSTNGSAPITRVTADIISASVTYQSTKCGKDGPVAAFVTSAGSVSGFTAVVPVPNGHEAMWFSSGIMVNGQTFPLQIKFPPPPAGSCTDLLTFCVKYTFTDRNCKSCEVIRCYGPFKRGGGIKIIEQIKNAGLNLP